MEIKRSFDLSSIKDFTRAERFKSYLENKGFKVETKILGFNGLWIKGIKED